ncbi:MAG: class I SAM-dependent methyltransferase [Clostridia bacterium]|nr:class I SAM-dependent methyltransferase [Clostridia bacterium]
MSSNHEKIFTFYGDGTMEEGREVSSRNTALEFYYTKEHLDEYITKDKRVLEVGCATGYYGLHYADRCREYVGIDLNPSHITLFGEKIAERKLANVSCQVGDATNLENIPDGSFDVVLCLGPMYHLPPEEREIAFGECIRVCKANGILAFAYLCKVGAYAGACVLDDSYPSAKANEYVLQKGTDDVRPGLFYFTMPEEMERLAARHGLKKLKNLGTNFMLAMKIVDEMDDERFAFMKPLYDQMASHESCTGMGDHALLVCRK